MIEKDFPILIGDGWEILGFDEPNDPDIVLVDFRSPRITEHLIHEDIKGLGIMISTDFLEKNFHQSRENIILAKQLGVPVVIVLENEIYPTEAPFFAEEMLNDLIQSVCVCEQMDIPTVIPYLEREEIPKLFPQKMVQSIGTLFKLVLIEPEWFMEEISGVPP